MWALQVALKPCTLCVCVWGGGGGLHIADEVGLREEWLGQCDAGTSEDLILTPSISEHIAGAHSKDRK